MTPVLEVHLESPADVMYTRRRAHRLGERLGLSAQDRTRFAAAASELARHAHHRGEGRLLMGVDGQALVVEARFDARPGGEPDEALEGA
ncbi:MAG TPA: hypothetical protein RMI62_13210, partial [Polyangiaceae bacterium LLY-WYZ-15_(1-7)]|nr:hypothetical protein [Polyangiaceae bacterium LLY-WYZ-15_(1-7)]